MKFSLLSAILFFSSQAYAETSCLAFMKDSQGGPAGNLPRQVISGERLLWDHDGITVTVAPATATFKNIAVTIINDGRKQLLVGETVWISGEYLSRSNEAYWILVDCEPVK